MKPQHPDILPVRDEIADAIFSRIVRTQHLWGIADLVSSSPKQQPQSPASDVMAALRKWALQHWNPES